MGKAVSDDGSSIAGTAWPAWVAALVLGPLLLAVVALGWPGQAIEHDLTDRADTALRDAGLAGAVVFDGRDATLHDVPAGHEQRAIDLVHAVDGVRTAHLAPRPTTPPSPTSEATQPPVVAAPAAPSGPAGSPVTTDATVAAAPAVTGEPVLDAAGVRLALDAVFADAAIGFRADSAQLTPHGAETARRVAEVLRTAPGVRVELAGHVGVAPGGAENARRLSEARAMAVHHLLVAAGVPAHNLVPMGYGDSQPEPDLVASRRVEIIVL